MDDQIWHYGNTGAIAAGLGWMIRNAFRAGRIAQHLEDAEERLGRFERDVIDRLNRLENGVDERLQRIETLLMEKK